MEITGKFIELLPEETGEGRNGPWKKQPFIIETQEQFPKKVCILVWGDKVDLKSFSPGQIITVSINIASREFNGKWYTDITAWRATTEEAPQTGSKSAPENIPPQEMEPYFDAEEGAADDLPF